MRHTQPSRAVKTVLVFLVFALSYIAPQSGTGQSRYEDALKPKIRPADQTHDYFSHAEDPAAAESLHLVEAYHLTDETFGRKFNAGFYWDAVEELRFVLSYFPNHPRALSLFNTCAALLQKPLLPLPYYDRAIHLFPGRALTYQQYGAYLLTIDKVEEAMKALQYAIKLDPKLIMAHAGLAKAYLKSGNRVLAKQELEAARTLGYKGKLDGLE